jgi:hypothetical protein
LRSPAVLELVERHPIGPRARRQHAALRRHLGYGAR